MGKSFAASKLTMRNWIGSVIALDPPTALGGDMRLLRGLTLLVAALGLTASVSASPIYFTFTGSVTNTYHYDPGSGGHYGVTIDGFAPGSPITYMFAVDYSQQAVEQDGYPALTNTYYPADYSDAYQSQDYFLASYVVGDAFPRTPLNGDYFNNRYDWGYAYSDTSGYHYAVLFDQRYIQNFDGAYYNWISDYLQVYGNCYSCSTVFQVGGTFNSYNFRGHYSNALGYYENEDQIEATLTLTSIDGEVPEPATLVLLGSGLTGLALRRRRKAA